MASIPRDPRLPPGLQRGRSGTPPSKNLKPVGAPRTPPVDPAVQRQLQARAFSHAFSGLTNELRNSGLDDVQADRFARLLLSRPGVTIGSAGRIHYKGKRFEPAAFAKSSLADFVTGRQAQRQNTAAIEGEPGYMQELAELGMTRDEATGAFDEQRRRALLDFGDPSFATDPLLAGEAAANPFSTSRLMAQQRDKQLGEVRQAANRYGTLFGGGLTSGMAGAERGYAGQNTEATRSLQDLLANLAARSSGARRNYEFGRTGALQGATQRLLESGQIHAAKPPTLRDLGYRFWGGRRRAPGFGG